MPIDRGNRPYYVSDERLRAYRALSPEDKLRWVEQLERSFDWLSPSKAPQPAKPKDTIRLRSESAIKMAAQGTAIPYTPNAVNA